MQQAWPAVNHTLEHSRDLRSLCECQQTPIMGGSTDGRVEDGQKPETVALSSILLWTGAMALVKQV